MATTGRLDTIAALTDRLVPLGDRQRGMTIQAEQWNTLVTVLRGILEIDRAQETGVAQSLADSFAKADHQHLGEVTLSWLDPDMQGRVTDDGSGGGSLSVRAALADVTARLGDTARQLAALSDGVERIQRRADDTSVGELARSAKLRSFEERFTGVEDLRGLVTTLSANMAGLQRSVQAVLDLRAQLTDAAGAPIDVRALAQRADTLSAAVDNATLGVDGRPLRLRDVEVTLQEVQDALGIGAGGGLEGRISALGADLQSKLDTRMDDRLAAQQQVIDQRLTDGFTQLSSRADENMRQAVGAAADALRTELSDSLSARISEVSQRLDSGLADLSQQTDAKIAAQARQSGQQLDALSASVDDRLTRVADAITQRVVDEAGDRVVSIVLDKVRPQLNDLAASTVANQLGDIRTQLKNLDARARRLEQP